jgi:hypothetical protein
LYIDELQPETHQRRQKNQQGKGDSWDALRKATSITIKGYKKRKNSICNKEVSLRHLKIERFMPRCNHEVVYNKSMHEKILVTKITLVWM